MLARRSHPRQVIHIVKEITEDTVLRQFLFAVQKPASGQSRLANACCHLSSFDGMMQVKPSCRPTPPLYEAHREDLVGRHPDHHCGMNQVPRLLGTKLGSRAKESEALLQANVSDS